MKIRKAVMAMFVSGAPIRRKGWAENVWLDYTQDDLNGNSLGFCGSHSDEKSLAVEDILADDWEVVE